MCTLQIQIQTSSVTHSSSWTSRQTYPTRWCKIEHIIIITILLLVIIIMNVKFMVTMIFMITMIYMIIMGDYFSGNLQFQIDDCKDVVIINIVAVPDDPEAFTCSTRSWHCSSSTVVQLCSETTWVGKQS